MKYLKFIEQFHDNNPIEIEFIKTQLKWDESQDEIEHILDFMFSNKHKKLEWLSYKLILAKTKKWDIQLQKVSSKDNEISWTDYEVYMDFNDGFKIVKLISKPCYEREWKLMSHCVWSYYGRDTTIYSLRDSKNNPHCTIENWNQIKGKWNWKIDPKYVDYIVKFLEKTWMIVWENEMKNLGYFKLDKIDKNLTCDSLYNWYIYQDKLDRVKDSEWRIYRGMGLWEVQDIVDIQDDWKFRLFEDIKSVVDYTKLVAWEDTKGHSTRNASSGNYTRNASSGNYTQNASSGNYTQNASSGDSTQNASSGDSTRNASSGHSTRNASSGNYTRSEINGKYGITADIGYQSKSKGIIGTWIVLAEYEKNIEWYWYPKYVKCEQIDWEILKENTWYMLKDWEFTITN